MFAPMWKGYFPEELHVGYVTNGVHMPTWMATEWKKYCYEKFDNNFIKDQSCKEHWKQIQQSPDEEIWQIRRTLKKKLIEYIKTQYTESWLKNQGDPSKVVTILDRINPDALLLGFGRRFATYKRAHLLFTDLDRLAKIVNNENYPVQIVFTGKAHPADGGGQGLPGRLLPRAGASRADADGAGRDASLPAIVVGGDLPDAARHGAVGRGGGLLLEGHHHRGRLRAVQL